MALCSLLSPALVPPYPCSPQREGMCSCLLAPLHVLMCVHRSGRLVPGLLSGHHSSNGS